MTRLPPLLTLSMLCSLAVPSVASAKDLRGRLGLGFNNQFGQLSALSVRYGLPTPDPAINIQVEAAAGFADVQGGDTNVFGGGRVLYGVVAEDNMNLYLAGGAGLVGMGADQAIRYQAAMGAEFFLFGLENLGFMTEWGVNVDVGDVSSSQTVGAMGVGVHYWF